MPLATFKEGSLYVASVQLTRSKFAALLKEDFRSHLQWRVWILHIDTEMNHSRCFSSSCTYEGTAPASLNSNIKSKREAHTTHLNAVPSTSLWRYVGKQTAAEAVVFVHSHCGCILLSYLIFIIIQNIQSWKCKADSRAQCAPLVQWEWAIWPWFSDCSESTGRNMQLAYRWGVEQWPHPHRDCHQVRSINRQDEDVSNKRTICKEMSDGSGYGLCKIREWF